MGPAPGLEFVCDIAVQVAAPLAIGDVGAGVRRIVDILGGTVTGPLLSGRIRPGGADFQLIRAGGVAELHARYVIEAASGALIYVENTGLRSGPAAVLARLNRGEAVDPALVYFRSAPRFETAAPELKWLMENLFLATGVRRPDAVELTLFRVV